MLLDVLLDWVKTTSSQKPTNQTIEQRKKRSLVARHRPKPKNAMSVAIIKWQTECGMLIFIFLRIISFSLIKWWTNWSVYQSNLVIYSTTIICGPSARLNWKLKWSEKRARVCFAVNQIVWPKEIGDIRPISWKWLRTIERHHRIGSPIPPNTRTNK